MSVRATEIILTTVNATYQHAAFGLRYLRANLGDLEPRSSIQEFTLAQKPLDVAESLIALNPKIVGFGVYIWNTRFVLDVCRALKRLRPECLLVLGGPEVSYEAEGQALLQVADYVVQGESEFLFRSLCQDFLTGQSLPKQKILRGELPPIQNLQLPYRLYTDEDIRNRFIYVEASRGCPFKCEFCLSSLDTSVRAFPLDTFLGEMQRLLDRGALHFKFVDRTFNLNIAFSRRILEFFLERMRPDLFLHFEMIPDRLPTELRELIARFPAGCLQFEIGVQTFNDEVGKLISRKQDVQRLADNMRFLVNETHVHIHADLIVGLPGETVESFARGFDRLHHLKPHEIQVGMLKRLKGTPIVRHDREWEMLYDEAPPFRVLQTKSVPYEQMQEMERFAKFWDLYANSGHFRHLLALMEKYAGDSFFTEFFNFAKFLNIRHPQRYAIALVNLVESAWTYYAADARVPKDELRAALIQDYCLAPRRDVPVFLREAVESEAGSVRRATSSRGRRQQRHLEAEVKCSVTQTISVAPAPRP